MAKKFKAYVERPKPKKRPRVHKKSKNKDEKRSYKKYNRQGRQLNSILIGGSDDPNIKSLKPYINNFIDIKSNIVWDINKDYITINNKLFNPTSLFYKYNYFETNQTNNIIQNFNCSLLHNYIQYKKKLKIFNRYHFVRPIQKLTNLMLAKNLGFNIPNTEYSKGDGKQLKVVKPIDGGMYTEEGTSTKYSCIIQEKIIGYNKRLYLINDKYFCFKINTDFLDFRDDDKSTIDLCDVSKDTLNKSFKLAKKLKLNFCCLDFMTNTKDWFLEINTNPFFSEFNKITNNKLAKTLHEELNK